MAEIAQGVQAPGRGTDPARLGLWIDGARREAASGKTIESTNPATGEVVCLVAQADETDVDDAVAAAKRAFPAWRELPPLERARMVASLGDLVERHAEELCLLDVLDNGSPAKEMIADARNGAWALRYFAGLALELRGHTVPTGHNRLDYTLRQPYGVVGRIVPFNHPLLFAARSIAAPLVAGNTVVLKPSEYTSMSAVRLGELASEVLPPGVLNVITGFGHDAGDALVRHPDVRRLAFTGSVPTGRRIQLSAASAGVKHVTLELGGKNPIVVFPDADIDAAIEGAVFGMNFTWQGQSCGSTSRLLVHSSLHDDFVARLAQRLEAMRSGMPEDAATDTGAIVNKAQYDKVLSYIDIAVSDGARVRAGGGRPDDPSLDRGLFIRPTLLDDVAPDSRVAQEEIFGPVLSVITFDTYDDAVAIANSVEYGLTASVFTQDLKRAHSFARDVEAGFVWVNDSSRHFPGVPFGGFKESGVGTEESFEELESYTQLKNVNVRFDGEGQ
jgi:betaine-aldehyde dehydrogenase